MRVGVSVDLEPETKGMADTLVSIKKRARVRCDSIALYFIYIHTHTYHRHYTRTYFFIIISTKSRRPKIIEKQRFMCACEMDKKSALLYGQRESKIKIRLKRI